MTQDLGLWAICTTGVFRGSLRGLFRKRAEVEDLIPYSHIDSIQVEPSGPHSQRIVLKDTDGREVARIDFSAGGMENTPEMAAAHCSRVYQRLQQAAAAAR